MYSVIPISFLNPKNLCTLGRRKSRSTKITFLSFLSIKEAEDKICELTKAAKKSLAFLGDRANDLCDVADYLAFRNK